MARKKSEPKAEKESNPAKDLLKRIRDRFKVMSEADQENRRLAMEDMKFTNVPGEQWDALMKKERGNRPCREFNKLRITCKRVINDIRANRPASKVRGVEGADKKTAEVYDGLIRNINNISDFDTITDGAAEYQTIGGMGAWRIKTRYVEEDAFEQEIVEEAIPNPFCLYVDPACKDQMKRDAQDWILTDRVTKAAYEKRWPKADKVDWDDSEFDDESDWKDDETVRIVEYWYKEPYDKVLLQLDDGTVVDGASDEAPLIPPERIKNKRVAVCNRIKMCIASGDAILEEADWAGSQFPFVMVYGEYMIIDGKTYWWGLPRFGKDAQRSYNLSRTAAEETVAQAPLAKWWATVEQAKGLNDQWSEAHLKNFPFMLYNPDGKSPGPPVRMPGADVPAALMAQAETASEDIKAVTGIYDASLGNRSNETSGIAINARQEQGQIATFNYQDNIAKAIKRNAEILIDLIPKIYDTERELRILGADGAEDYAKVNQIIVDPATNKPIKVNDLATGRYDVTVTVGPNWSTKRQEAAEIYTSMDKDGSLKAIAGDLMFKAMDLPYSDEIAERIKVMLPPPIQSMLNQDKQVPPEAQAVMAQANQAMQMVEQQMQMVQQAAQQVQQEQMKVDKGKSEIQVAIANLESKQAQFEATVAKQLAQLTQKEAQLVVKETQQAGTEQAQSAAGESAQTISAIQAAAQEFMQAASAVLQQIQAQTVMQSAATVEMARPKPRLVKLTSQRVNGNLEAIPVYEDQLQS